MANRFTAETQRIAEFLGFARWWIRGNQAVPGLSFQLCMTR